MSFFGWFAPKKPCHTAQPIAATSMPSDEWLDWMLEILDEKERRTGVKIVDPWPEDY